jgi:hypothetical protein
LKIFLFIEAKYVGIWNNGRRQGPGELQFNQYKYVGKFQENYVSNSSAVENKKNLRSSSRKEKVNSYSKMDINKMENTI